MLTTSETAEILGVSTASIRVWLNEEGRPRFPNAQKFGRDWQIPESDLEGLPRGRKRGRPPKRPVGEDGQVGQAAAVGSVLTTDTTKPKPRAWAKKAGVKKASKKGAVK